MLFCWILCIIPENTNVGRGFPDSTTWKHFFPLDVPIHGSHCSTVSVSIGIPLRSINRAFLDFCWSWVKAPLPNFEVYWEAIRFYIYTRFCFLGIVFFRLRKWGVGLPAEVVWLGLDVELIGVVNKCVPEAGAWKWTIYVVFDSMNPVFNKDFTDNDSSD